MNVGERIKFFFGGKEREGVVTRVFPKKVYLKVDFPKHPGKIIIRALAELEGKGPERKKKEKPKKAKKEKTPKGKKGEEKEE